MDLHAVRWGLAFLLFVQSTFMVADVISGVAPIPWMFPTIGINAGALIGTYVGPWIVKRRHKTPVAPKPQNASFCKDCGRFLITSTQGNGFDIHTGKQRFTYLRHCTDAKFGATNFPFCGNTNNGLPVPGMHTHTAPEEVHITCPACIDAMARDGVIPKAKAEELYAAIGAKLGRGKSDQALDLDLDPFGSLTYGSMMRAMGARSAHKTK